MNNETIKLKRKDVKDILKELFPDYKGRKITLQIKEYYNYVSSNSYWSGGYKSNVRILNLSNGRINVSSPNELANPLIMNHGTQRIDLLSNVMVVVHQFAGTSQWITFYVGPNSDFMPKLLTN